MHAENVAHYRLVKEIGSGGMGIVYRAEDMKLGRPVAPRPTGYGPLTGRGSGIFEIAAHTVRKIVRSPGADTKYF